ncbi:MAG TPA: class I SAM-dependent methyltransferase [Steroidobacteraceae bacterium]|jgi:SAM-dependent methyltransferase|nr:class I SAM-dependent methyltransferase [Steroidobacteraceae bacterium]
MSHSPPFVHDFSDAAEQYAASRPKYPESLFRSVAALAPATNGAWDCGTGNGQAAVGLAAHFESVYATDTSEEQIAQALPHPRIEYRVAPAEHSGLKDGSVDIVSVAQALHWFDLRPFYEEVRRVVRPGGLIAVYGYTWFYLTPALDELTNRWLLEPIEPYWSPKVRMLWDGYSTIDFPFEGLTAPALAVHLTWNLDELLSYYLTWSATRRKIANEGDDFLTAARAAFDAAWGVATERRHVVMPIAMRLGRLG